MSPEMRGPRGNLLDCEELADALIRFGGEGVTVSGGEPFAQAEAVARVISLVRREIDYGVIVYSGYTFEELSERAGSDGNIARLLGEIDILIDGPYVAELDDGRPYRGSSNQRILPLTGRYDSVLDSYYNESCGRRTEINIGLSGFTLTGVPSAEMLSAWERMKGSGGTCILAGEDKARGSLLGSRK
jgi:anaerobic ribonucleoside-triphosphate reductase activating protein